MESSRGAAASFVSGLDRRLTAAYIVFGVVALYIFPEQFFGHPELQWIKTYLQFTFPIVVLFLKIAVYNGGKSNEEVMAEIAGLAQGLVTLVLLPNALIALLMYSLIFIIPTHLLFKAGVPGPLAFSIVMFGFVFVTIFAADRMRSGKSR